MIHFFKTIVTVTHPSALVKPHFQDYNKKSFRFREDYGLFQAVSPVSGLTPDYPENTRRPEALKMYTMCGSDRGRCDSYEYLPLKFFHFQPEPLAK